MSRVVRLLQRLSQEHTSQTDAGDALHDSLGHQAAARFERWIFAQITAGPSASGGTGAYSWQEMLVLPGGSAGTGAADDTLLSGTGGTGAVLYNAAYAWGNAVYKPGDLVVLLRGFQDGEQTFTDDYPGGGTGLTGPVEDNGQEFLIIGSGGSSADSCVWGTPATGATCDTLCEQTLNWSTCDGAILTSHTLVMSFPQAVRFCHSSTTGPAPPCPAGPTGPSGTNATVATLPPLLTTYSGMTGTVFVNDFPWFGLPNPATSAATGFIQIPKMTGGIASGAPANRAGFVSTTYVDTLKVAGHYDGAAWNYPLATVDGSGPVVITLSTARATAAVATMVGATPSATGARGVVPAPQPGDDVKFLRGDGAYAVPSAGATGGTVTSVGLSLPGSVFTVTGSPVTNTGTLTGTFVNQNANTFFAGPTGGGAATPTVRAIVGADLPVFVGATAGASGATGAVRQPLAGDQAKVLLGGGVWASVVVPPDLFAVSASAAAGTLTIAKVAQTANVFWAGPTGGAAAMPGFRAVVGADLPVFVGATPSINGVKGAVPQPLVGDQSRYLKGNSAWADAVSSVGLFLPGDVFTVSGSPVTTVGTLSGALVPQTARTVWAGPATGAAAPPVFRTLQVTDMPGTGGTGMFADNKLGTWVNGVLTALTGATAACTPFVLSPGTASVTIVIDPNSCTATGSVTFFPVIAYLRGQFTVSGTAC